VGGICRVNVYCVQDFYVIIYQNLLSSIFWNRVVSDGSVVSRTYFGQVVSPPFPFRRSCPLTQWKELEVDFLSSIVFLLLATAKGCAVCFFAMASSAALKSTLIA
jgi:hypothetical protein